MTRIIHIADYAPAWVEAFTELSRALKSALGELALGIEHVGSTSVPDLGAKPIIDLDVIIDSPITLPSVIEAYLAASDTITRVTWAYREGMHLVERIIRCQETAPAGSGRAIISMSAQKIVRNCEDTWHSGTISVRILTLSCFMSSSRESWPIVFLAT